jgi:hypothetical protein
MFRWLFNKGIGMNDTVCGVNLIANVDSNFVLTAHFVIVVYLLLCSLAARRHGRNWPKP